MRRPPTIFQFLLLVTILWATLRVNSQQANPYELISTTQGLNQGMVFRLLADRDGFLWIATKEGLNRFDGYSFKSYTYDPYNNHSLSSNNARTLTEDSKGRIWIGTLDAGINVYDRISGEFRRITNRHGDPSSLIGNRVRLDVIELPDGKMLAAPEPNGLDLISLPDNYFKGDSPALINHLAVPHGDSVMAMGKDDMNNVWIACHSKKVYRFEPRDQTMELLFDGRAFTPILSKMGHYAFGTDMLLWSMQQEQISLFDSTKRLLPNVIFRDTSGKFRIMDQGVSYPYVQGIHTFDFSKAKVGVPAEYFGKNINVFGQELLSITLDKAGNLWVGTSGLGLRKYNIAANRFRHFAPGFSPNLILPFNSDKMLLCGWGFDIWINNHGAIIQNNLPERIRTHPIRNFLISRSGEYWVNQDQFHFFRYNPTTDTKIELPVTLRSLDERLPIIEDRQGDIWAADLGGLLIRTNPETNEITRFDLRSVAVKQMLPDAQTTTFYEDGQGVFWIGTEEGFASITLKNRFDKSPKITWYKNDVGNRNSLSYNFISCILDDPSDNNFLWICTKGGGLNRLDKSTGNFMQLTTKDGLPNDYIYGMLADSSGNLWGSTNRGIFCLLANSGKNNKAWEFRNFSKVDGLQDDEFNTGAFAKLPNGDLAFGGVNGINIFDPHEVLEEGFKPNVFITKIQIGNQTLLPNDNTGVLKNTIEQTSEIRLSYQQDVVTLEFSSLDFTAPGQNKYRYQLVGVDKDWIESGTRRFATYLHLPSGSFVFKVQGTNSQGIWSEKIAELKITVLPPWWRTWWAYLLYVLLVALAIRTYFKFSVNRAKLQSQLSFEQIEAKRVKELDTVKTQLYTNITHEFRTPLTVILGMAHQVVEKPKEHFDNGMNMIIRNGESLLNLVNEMLDLSKLETGKMQLQLSNGDVINFLRYIVESFHSLAESQQKQVHFLAEMDLSYRTYDGEKLRQIVSNLLSNALKFTPKRGNIYINISESTAPNSFQSNLIIKVKDTGIGIAEEQIEHIFDRFHQADNSHTRRAEGTGIGLALTKELVRLMEGEIAVKSPPVGATKGSEFTVILPLKKVEATEDIIRYQIAKESSPQKTNAKVAQPADIKSDQKNKGQPLILLVEDNADVVAYTASCLPDYRLAVARDGREGFEIATDIIPDLIITDVMMPFVDGFELVRKLRVDEHTSHVPIIMLTAKADIESKMEGLTQGADAYLEKPFNKDELLIRIRKLLELRKNLQEFYLKKAGLSSGMAIQEEKSIQPIEVKERKKEDEFVIRVREAIVKNLSDPEFTVEQLCKLIFMSHSQLHRKLEALIGCSPNKFIRMVRLNKAKELLKNPNNSIASISLDCGYNDPGYFARIFKQEHGVTPQEWRMSNAVN